MNTLIITDVHARDLVERFQQDGVADARDFAWESQLRFYWDRSSDGVVIRQCNGARSTCAICRSLPVPDSHDGTNPLPAPGNHGKHDFACFGSVPAAKTNHMEWFGQQVQACTYPALP